jgi:hypothetical protein
MGLRWLRWESGNDAFPSILQSHIVACTSFTSSRNFGLRSLIFCLDLLLNLRVRFLNEYVPSKEVDHSPSSYKRIGDFIASNSKPYLGVKFTNRIAFDVRSECKVFVESSEVRLDLFEVLCLEGGRELRHFCRLHGGGLRRTKLLSEVEFKYIRATQ